MYLVTKVKFELLYTFRKIFIYTFLEREILIFQLIEHNKKKQAKNVYTAYFSDTLNI